MSFVRKSFQTRWNRILALALALTAGVASVTAFPQGSLVPSYIYPGSVWTNFLNTRAVGSVIINPNSGPGTAPDANYQAVTKAAKAAGIKVLGYVHTSYGQRNATDVLNEIQRFLTWYNVDGIFLDETASAASMIPYYDAIARQIHALPGLIVVLNCGVHPAEGYMNVGDVIVTFENTYKNYLNLKYPSWVFKYAPTRFCHIVHTTSNATSMKEVIRLSQQRNAAFVYATDDSGANPYDKVPTFWSSETAEVLKSK